MSNDYLNSFVMSTPFGNIECRCHQSALVQINLNTAKRVSDPKSDIERETYYQIKSYLSGQRETFSLPVEVNKSDFQNHVCQALKAIPFGRTLTYGELATRLKSSARAVGGGCRRNPIPVVIPCHRVVAANGIGGFAGQTSGNLIDAKQWLLKHEQDMLKNGDC